jgi:carbonic anhydrase
MMAPVEFTPNADDLLANNARFAATFPNRHLSVRPARRVAIVACMDSRMDMFQMLGLADGEAHIIRNAGGVVTDDVIRSLCVSQRLLDTREIILVHHTDCGLEQLDAVRFKDELEAEVGLKPAWSLESFREPFADVRQSIQRLRTNPFVKHKDHIRGFVYDVDTGRLDEA